MSIATPATSGPNRRPHALRRRRETRRSRRGAAAGISLKSSAHASVITVPPRDRDREDQPVVPVVPLLRESGDEQAGPVDERGEEDHPRQPEAVAERPRDHGGHDVADGDGREHRGRRRERLAETLRDVEDDERSHRGERPLPGRVRDQEWRTSGSSLKISSSSARSCGLPRNTRSRPPPVPRGRAGSAPRRPPWSTRRRAGTARGARRGTGSRRRRARTRSRSRA